MATYYFSPFSVSAKPFAKATHKADVSFMRNPQHTSVENQLGYDFDQYRQGEESLNEKSLNEFFERYSPDAVYSASLNIGNNGMSMIEIQNVSEI